MIGLVLGIAGVAILLLSGDSGLAVGGDAARAVAWSLPGIAAFSFSTVYAKRQSASLAGFVVMVIQFTIAAVLMVIPMLVFEGLPRLDGGSWALLIYLAVGSTVVPLMLFYWVLERNSAGQASLVGFLVPIVAVVAGVVLLSERAGPGLVAGGLAIICGVLIADRGGFTGTRLA
jgi:drug/metabolite transporter (DMT)-like permease